MNYWPGPNATSSTEPGSFYRHPRPSIEVLHSPNTADLIHIAYRLLQEGICREEIALHGTKRQGAVPGCFGRQLQRLETPQNLKIENATNIYVYS